MGSKNLFLSSGNVSLKVWIEILGGNRAMTLAHGNLNATKVLLLFFMLVVWQPVFAADSAVIYAALKKKIAPIAGGENEGELRKAMEAFLRGDYGTELRIVRPLAEAGDPYAQFALALMYEQGGGVPQNRTEAIRWHQKAAEQGHPSAQSELAYFYEHGEGVPQNISKAVALYKAAAERGLAAAQHNLGTLYSIGKGVPKDNTEAVKWLRLAAKQGEGVAQINLGHMYASGLGVAKDNYRAYIWFKLATVSDVLVKDEIKRKADTLRSVVAKKISQQQVARAEKSVMDCMQEKYRECD